MHFLTPNDIVRLTGRKRPLAQAEMLRKKWGIEPFISATGEVNLTWDTVEQAQRRRSGLELQKVARRGPRPNLEAVS